MPTVASGFSSSRHVLRVSAPAAALRLAQGTVSSPRKMSRPAARALHASFLVQRAKSLSVALITDSIGRRGNQ